MKVFLCFLISFLFCFPLFAEESQIPDETELVFDDESFETGESDETDLIFEEEPSDELSPEDESGSSSLLSGLLEPARFTLRHELAYKIEDPAGIKNNRSSFRLEYSKFFLNYFYLQCDAKINAFWGNDHRAEAEDEAVLFETGSKEAFLQVSFANTSIKAGMQVLIWGESDGGAITDVISPRDSSELFFISLEEARIGQPMLTVDQFSPIGDWSFFFIPEPEFNEYPEKGTAYYVDPYDGLAEYQDENSDDEVFEYGLRWKKTFGKRDLSFMAASVIDNDYATRLDEETDTGEMLFTKMKQRYTLVGTTFNYARGNFLLKGEIGVKFPKTFYNASMQIVEKDVVDTALGVEYSPGTYTVSLEAVNNHVLDWTNDIQGTPEDSNSLVISWSNTFLHETLSVDWMTSYSAPYTSFLHSFATSYDWNDHLTLSVDAYYIDVKDKDSSFWMYRDQQHVVCKIQYQF